MWKDSIQRLFRYRKITPSPTLWEQLEAQLAESEAQQAKHKSRKVWYYAIAASLLLCLGIGYLLKENHTAIRMVQQENTIASVPPAHNDKQQTPLSSFSKTESASSKERNMLLPPVPKRNMNNEVDSLLGNINSEQLLVSELAVLQRESAEAHNKEEAALLKDLEKLSPQELLLMASTEINLEKYVETQYNANKLLSDTEKEIFKDRIQRVLDKIVNKFNEVRLAIE